MIGAGGKGEEAEAVGATDAGKGPESSYDLADIEILTRLPANRLLRL